MVRAGVEALYSELAVRDARWSEAIAVGSLAFAATVKRELGMKAMHREVEQAGGTYVLRESSEAYGSEFAQENEVLRSENTIRGRNLPKLLSLSVVRPATGSKISLLAQRFLGLLYV